MYSVMAKILNCNTSPIAQIWMCLTKHNVRNISYRITTRNLI